MTFGYRLITDKQGRIQFKQRVGRKKHFHVAVYVDESPETLERIKLVEYRLHDSFAEPIRHNDQRDRRFEESFYTWGKFTIVATILYMNGETEKYQFYLNYTLPPDHGLNYVEIPVE